MQQIAELQKRWHCDLHSKDKDAYCYQDVGSVCYELTIQNMTFWALEIVRTPRVQVRSESMSDDHTDIRPYNG